MHDFVEIHAARQSEILGDVKWIDQGCIGGRCRAGRNDGSATESTDEWRTAFGRLRRTVAAGHSTVDTTVVDLPPGAALAGGACLRVNWLTGSAI
jgi:hypothetical protein